MAKQVETAGEPASIAGAIAAPPSQKLPPTPNTDAQVDQQDIDALLTAAGQETNAEEVAILASPATSFKQNGPKGSGGAPQVQNFDFPTFEARSTTVLDAKRVSMLSDVNLRVKIELGRTRMLVEDVLKLSEGSVVELDKLAGDPVDVYANDRLVARGEVLVLDDSFCVRISDVVSRGTRIESYGDDMARCRIWSATIVGCMNAMLLAASPGESDPPGSHALPTPNQSLSIEEVSLTPGGQRDGTDSGRMTIDEVPESGTRNDLIPAGTDAAAGKAPIFLGKKRVPGDADSQAASHPDTPWYRSSFGALALVLALMAVLYFALKRWAPSMKMQDGGLVRVMCRTVVGPRQSLILLRVGRRVVLVGVSPDRIDRVCEIADADEVTALTLQASNGQSRGEFSAWLDREAAEFVGSDKSDAGEIVGSGKRSGSKSLSDLLQKLRTTKV